MNMIPPQKLKRLKAFCLEPLIAHDYLVKATATQAYFRNNKKQTVNYERRIVALL